MNKSDKDKLYLTLFLVMLVALDLCVIGGVLWKGKANFPELIKHLQS